VGRGGPIDGYLPPLRLQRIAAAAAAHYVPHGELEIDQRLQARRRGEAIAAPIPVDVNHSIDAREAVPLLSTAASPMTREHTNVFVLSGPKCKSARAGSTSAHRLIEAL
jgi:hypothetical protein